MVSARVATGHSPPAGLEPLCRGHFSAELQLEPLEALRSFHAGSNRQA